MFEKEAEEAGNEKIKGNHQFARCARKSYKDGFKDGAEFGYNWLSIKVCEMNLPCKRHRSEIKLSAHSCKHTGEAHDMIRYLSKTFTMASIARVFGYSAERIRQICADNEE